MSPLPMRRPAGQIVLPASLVIVLFLACAPSSSAQAAVTTYHNDNNRTGWNSNESELTPANVNASQFGLLGTVAVDDEVDAQPLLVPGVTITAGNYPGTHDVVYVVTANNTVYAIDANTYTVLLTTNLGAPVPLPLHCNNNGPNVGVNSTPVIDANAAILYVMAYTSGSAGPVFTLHALNLGNLADSVTPEVVSASHLLTNGTMFEFNATYQRQRPALLEANGNIYAGFGSFCDLSPSLSRGWLLGWNAATLAPLAANQVLDTQATDVSDFYLASIWMSGSGPAADDSGNVVFVTGNSDPTGTTYDGVTSIQESVVKVSSDLSTVLDLFTPTDWPSLDEADTDFGAGGVLVLPDQPGSTPHLAVAAGKDGNMYFMNEDNLGGYSSSGNNVLGTYSIGKCWCGESYTVDGQIPFVISSGNDVIKLFRVGTTPSPKLQLALSATISTGQDEGHSASGFYTSVSSNHKQKNTIIWAVSRPLSATQPGISLYALGVNLQQRALTQLFTASAGTWPYYGGHYNLPPTVANGKVYVASYQVLNIFGLLPSPAKQK